MSAKTTAQDFLPMHVQQTAMTQQLGPFVKSYTAALIWCITWIIVDMMAALLLVWFAAVCVLVAIRTGDWSTAFGLVVVLGMTALCISGIVRMVRAAGRKVYLFQQGLIVENKGQIQVFPWNQTTKVWQSITIHGSLSSIYVGITYNYHLCREDGYQIKLGYAIKDIAELDRAITQGVTRELFPRAMHSILGGQTLTFAKFSINQEGIGNGREFLSWSQVEAVNVNSGRVKIKKAGKFWAWGSAMVAGIPNCLVFINIAEEMIRQNRASVKK